MRTKALQMRFLLFSLYSLCSFFILLYYQVILLRHNERSAGVPKHSFFFAHLRFLVAHLFLRSLLCFQGTVFYSTLRTRD